TKLGTRNLGILERFDAGRKPLRSAVWLSLRRSKASLVSTSSAAKSSRQVGVVLRQQSEAYRHQFAAENEVLTPKNTTAWQRFAATAKTYPGPTSRVLWRNGLKA